MFEDSVSYLQRKSENGWTIIDTLTNYTIFGNYNNVPRLEITDFNRDGYQDLIVVSLTNVNGNQWGKIFIYNPQANQLQIIKSAEDTTLYWTNGIWSSPEYNPKDSTITCTHFTSMNGFSYTSKYKLIGNEVIPIEKDEDDDSKMNSKGIGSVHRHYKGLNGKWKKDWQR